MLKWFKCSNKAHTHTVAIDGLVPYLFPILSKIGKYRWKSLKLLNSKFHDNPFGIVLVLKRGRIKVYESNTHAIFFAKAPRKNKLFKNLQFCLRYEPPYSPRCYFLQESRSLSAKWLPTFADRGCHVVSVTDPYGRILGFLHRSLYFSIK
jgi:hypothetical protein